MNRSKRFQEEEVKSKASIKGGIDDDGRDDKERTGWQNGEIEEL